MLAITTHSYNNVNTLKTAPQDAPSHLKDSGMLLYHKRGQSTVCVHILNTSPKLSVKGIQEILFPAKSCKESRLWWADASFWRSQVLDDPFCTVCSFEHYLLVSSLFAHVLGLYFADEVSLCHLAPLPHACELDFYL